MLLEAVRDQEEASAPALWLYGERVLPEHGYVCERELWCALVSEDFRALGATSRRDGILVMSTSPRHGRG